MSDQKLFRIDDAAELRRAGAGDLVELLPVPGQSPLFVQKWLLQVLARGIATGEMIHLSGPTGCAKSSLVEALAREPRNFTALLASMDLPERPIVLFPIEMVTFEAPGELFQVRGIKEGSSFSEPSCLVQALRAAETVKHRGEAVPLIWLREIGRVMTASVQNGLLNLMTRGDIRLPDGGTVDGGGIAWIADSNYQAQSDDTHTLVPLDTAFARRFTLQLTLDYLPPDKEVAIMARLHAGVPRERVESVVRLGQIIRRHRAEGSLESVPPPTIYGYDALLRLAAGLPGLTLPQLAAATLLGNASAEDRKRTATVFAEAFPGDAGNTEDNEMGGPLL